MFWKRQSFRDSVIEELRRNPQAYSVPPEKVESYAGYLVMNAKDAERKLPLSELLKRYPSSEMPDRR